MARLMLPFVIGLMVPLAAQETEFRVRLLSPVDTRTNKVGDQVVAQVLAPAGWDGAMFEGKIRESKGGGKVKGTAALGISFDTLVHQGKSQPVQAVIKGVTNSQGLKDVDEEGRMVKKKNNLGRIALLSGIGAAAGAVAGGGRGAAIGAGAGAAAALIITQVAVEGTHIAFAAGSEFTLGVKPARTN